MHAGGSGVRLYGGPDLKLFILVGWGRSFLSVAWPTGVQLVFFFCSGVTRYKIQETLFRVDIQIYNSVTLAMGYFVDKHSKNSVHVYIR